jgi:hypothetical protein
MRTRFDAAGRVLVDSPGGAIVDVGPRGFTTLAVFARPLALGVPIEQLEVDERGSADFVPTMSVINMSIEEGAVVPRTPTGVRRGAGPIRWSMRACSTTAGGQVSAVLSGPFEINKDVGSNRTAASSCSELPWPRSSPGTRSLRSVIIRRRHADGADAGHQPSLVLSRWRASHRLVVEDSPDPADFGGCPDRRGTSVAILTG